MLVDHDDGEAVVSPRACTVARRPLSARPPQGDGAYKLPRDVQERLRTALAGVRNGEAAERLAAFLGRFWSTPTRLCSPYPIDRRALADHRLLGLTEAEVRGAVRTLERVGFLTRDLPRGSGYRATADGLRRKPILFQFGGDYGGMFASANRRAARTRSTSSPTTTASAVTTPVRGPTQSVETIPWSPKSKSYSESTMLMGDQKTKLADPEEALSPLDRALQSWGRAIEREQTGTV